MEAQANLFTIREVNISYWPSKELIKAPKIHSSKTAYDYLFNAFTQQSMAVKEEFNVLLLNRANKPIGVYRMSTGGIDSTVVDVRLLMTAALKSLATGMILSHNHPSGQLSASDGDLRVTANIKKACKIMDISLLDHLILDPFGGYMSFADEGLL